MTSGLVSPVHIMMLALVALLLFGPKRLPEMGRSLGHGMREFKDSITGDERQRTDADDVNNTIATVEALPSTEPSVNASPPLTEHAPRVH